MFGPVGPACNSGVPHRMAQPPLSEGQPTLPPFLSRGDGVSGARDKSNAGETGNFSGGSPFGGAGISVKHLPSAEERRGHRPIINLKKLNEFIPHLHFKMEGIHMLKDLLRQGDFMAKIDLKDAYFAVPISEEDRKYLGKQNVSIQLPSFWAIMRSLGLYQDNQGSSFSPERNGHQAHHLHRRHSGHGRVGDSTERPCGRDYLPPGELGIRDKLPQVATGTNESYRFPRLSTGLDRHGAQTPRRQDKEPQGGDKKDPGSRSHNSLGLVQVAGQNECHNEGDSDGPSLLSATASGASNGIEQILSELWNSPIPLRPSKGGASMVDHPLNKLEWAEPHRRETECLTGDGRLANWLGSSMRGSEDGGVPGRDWSRDST